MTHPRAKYVPVAALVTVIAVMFLGIRSCTGYYEHRRKLAVLEEDLLKLRKARTQLDSLTELYGSTPRRDLSTVVIPELIKLRDQVGEIPTPEISPCLSVVSTNLRQAADKTLESVKAFADISYDSGSIEISAMLAESRSSLYLQEARSLKSKADQVLERSKSLSPDKFLVYCDTSKSK